MGRTKGHDVQQILDEPAEMRDGTVLCSDIYRPSGGGNHPVLVSRTPYDKASNEEMARGLAERGSQPRPYTEGYSYSRPAAVRPYISPRRRIRWTEIL